MVADSKHEYLKKRWYCTDTWKELLEEINARPRARRGEAEGTVQDLEASLAVDRLLAHKFEIRNIEKWLACILEEPQLAMEDLSKKPVDQQREYARLHYTILAHPQWSAPHIKRLIEVHQNFSEHRGGSLSPPPPQPPSRLPGRGKPPPTAKKPAAEIPPVARSLPPSIIHHSALEEERSGSDMSLDSDYDRAAQNTITSKALALAPATSFQQSHDGHLSTKAIDTVSERKRTLDARNAAAKVDDIGSAFRVDTAVTQSSKEPPGSEAVNLAAQLGPGNDSNAEIVQPATKRLCKRSRPHASTNSEPTSGEETGTTNPKSRHASRNGSRSKKPRQSLPTPTTRKQRGRAVSSTAGTALLSLRGKTAFDESVQILDSADGSIPGPRLGTFVPQRAQRTVSFATTLVNDDSQESPQMDWETSNSQFEDDIGATAQSSMDTDDDEDIPLYQVMLRKDAERRALIASKVQIPGVDLIEVQQAPINHDTEDERDGVLPSVSPRNQACPSETGPLIGPMQNFVGTSASLVIESMDRTIGEESAATLPSFNNPTIVTSDLEPEEEEETLTPSIRETYEKRWVLLKDKVARQVTTHQVRPAGTSTPLADEPQRTASNPPAEDHSTKEMGSSSTSSGVRRVADVVGADFGMETRNSNTTKPVASRSRKGRKPKAVVTLPHLAEADLNLRLMTHVPVPADAEGLGNVGVQAEDTTRRNEGNNPSRPTVGSFLQHSKPKSRNPAQGKKKTKKQKLQALETGPIAHDALQAASLPSHPQVPVMGGIASSLLSEIYPPNPQSTVQGTAAPVYSSRLDVVQPTLPKPPLPKRPLVWARTRQELCEGTPYFRSYQGGVYLRSGIARGYLLDGYGSPRDICSNSGRLIISHAGGRSHYVTTSSQSGQLVPHLELKKDQEEDQSSAQALYNNWRLQKPLVLVIGKNYSLFPFDLGDAAYVVLGWYLVTEFWTELEVVPGSDSYCKRIKVAFQWLPSQGPAFFDVDGVPLEPTATPCLNAKNSPSHTPDAGLDGIQMEVKVQESLSQRRKRLLKTPRSRVVSTLVCDGRDPRGIFSAEHGSREDICKVCLENSPQVYDGPWMCLNGTCRQVGKSVDGAILDLSKLKYAASWLQPRDNMECIAVPYGIQPCSSPCAEEYDGFSSGEPFARATLCYDCGKLSCREYLTEWKCTEPSCSEGVDELSVPAKLEVAPLTTRLHPTFSISTPDIKYHVATLRGGTDLPVCVTKFTLPEQCGDIYHIRNISNSLTGSLYYAYQRVYQFRRLKMTCTAVTSLMLAQQFALNSGMPYHYAAEAETVSLQDSPACVREALKTIDRSASLVQNAAMQTTPFNEALSILYLDGQKMNYHSDAEPGLGDVVASLSLGHPAFMDFRPYGRKSKGKRHLQIELWHGDVVVMVGRKIQEAYQHRVTPSGLRVGVTARQIYPQHLKPHEVSQLAHRLETGH